MKFKILLLLCLFGFSSLAFAENGCPDGMTPFQNGNDPSPKCYPMQDGQSTAPAKPRGRWLTRWGAIAMDENVGIFGAVKNFSSKRLASKAAITVCKENGGIHCETRLSYYNQCAVVAWGDTFYSARSEETIELAKSGSSARCNTLTKNCKIVYADCSLPVWVE